LTTAQIQIGDTGLEHPPLALTKSAISAGGGAKSGAHDAPKPISNPELESVIEAWPTLPEHIKVTIKTLVKSFKVTQRQEKGGDG